MQHSREKHPLHIRSGCRRLSLKVKLSPLGSATDLAVCLETLELARRVYESGAEWHAASTLITEHLAVSYGLVQVLLGSLCPFLLLLVAIRPKLDPRWMMRLSGLAGLLVLVQVPAMRWNVVVGGQLLSKSYRGFVEHTPPWGGHEGMIAAAVVLALPLLACQENREPA